MRFASRAPLCKIAFALAPVCLLALPSAASAAPAICVPQAVGVPGNSGPPVWWDPGDLYSSTLPTDKDPRWKGALRIAHGSGFDERVSLRALYHPSQPDGQPHLFLSWKVEAANYSSTVQRVMVAFAPVCTRESPCDENERYVIAADLGHSNGAAAREVASSPAWFETYLYEFSGSTNASGQEIYDAVASKPAWLSDARIWYSSDPAEMTWSVNLLVPIDDNLADGLPITDDFYMTYGTRIRSALGPSLATYPRDQMCGGSCPIDSSFSHDPVFTNQALVPLRDYWSAFHLGTNAECVEGISLSAQDIGILPEGAADPLTATLDYSIDREDENIFVARPENNTGATVGASTLRAVFRMANWGSTPTGGTIIDEGQWLDIYDDRPGEPPILNSSDILDGDKGVLEAEWHPETNTEMCLFGASGAGDCTGITEKAKHQCILVELMSNGGNYLFTNDSVHRNMNFIDAEAGASSFAFQAFISPRGAPRLPNGISRGVYVRVDARNMPKAVDPKDYERMIGKLDERFAKWRETGGSYADLARFMPTMIFHVYHETGERASDREYEGAPVLREQAAFGLFVNPPRKFMPEGWRVAIDGAVQIDEDLYRMEVSDFGTAVVQTRLKALSKDDMKFRSPDFYWRSEKHEDTRCMELDPELCEALNKPQSKKVYFGDALPVLHGDETEAYGADEAFGDGDVPPTAGCQAAPGGNAGSLGTLLLGLMVAAWLGLRRRASVIARRPRR